MGFSLAPMHGGQTLNEEQYEALPERERAAIEASIGGLKEQLEKLLRLVPVWHKERRERIRALNRDVALAAVSHLVDDVKRNFADLPRVQAYLDAVQLDVLDNVDAFRKTPEGEGPEGESVFARYRVNVV